jgi:hypothetical protein
MTNSEYDLQVALKALEENKLKDRAKTFIEDIKDYDKDALNLLTRKQYQFLHAISRKFDKTKGYDIKIFFNKINQLTSDISDFSNADSQSKHVATQIKSLVDQELARL